MPGQAVPNNSTRLSKNQSLDGYGSNIISQSPWDIVYRPITMYFFSVSNLFLKNKIIFSSWNFQPAVRLQNERIFDISGHGTKTRLYCMTSFKYYLYYDICSSWPEYFEEQIESVGMFDKSFSCIIWPFWSEFHFENTVVNLTGRFNKKCIS